MQRRFAILAGVLLAVTPLCITATGADVAAGASPTSTAIPCAYASSMYENNGQLAVDPATGDVFVSCTHSNNVTVLNGSGDIIETITGLNGAAGLTINDGTVYVALTSGAIDAINISSLAVTTLASGMGAVDSVAWADGFLWSPTGDNLDQINPTNGDVSSSPLPIDCGPYCTGIVGDPGDANILFVWDPGDSPVSITRVDVSTSPPTMTRVVEEGISNVNDIAAAPDGSSLVPAGGSPYQFNELNSESLVATGVVYPAVLYPSAVAMTGANGGLFAGADDPLSGPEVLIYRLDDPADLVAAVNVAPGGLGARILSRELGFSPDGSEVYAVSSASSATDAAESLSIIPAVATPFGTSATIISTLPVPLRAEQPLEVTVKVSPMTPAEGIPTGQVTVSTSDGPQTSAPCTLNASGSATCTIENPSAGTQILTARYLGDGNYASSTTPYGADVTLAQARPSTPFIANLPKSGIRGRWFLPAVQTNADGKKSVTSSTPSVCTATSGIVRYKKVGQCTLVAHVAVGKNFLGANGEGQNIKVVRG